MSRIRNEMKWLLLALQLAAHSQRLLTSRGCITIDAALLTLIALDLNYLIAMTFASIGRVLNPRYII